MKKLFFTALGTLAVALAAMLALRNIAPTSPRADANVSPRGAQGSLSGSGVPDASPSVIKGDPDLVKKIVQRHDEQVAARRGLDSGTSDLSSFLGMVDFHEVMEKEPGLKKFRAMTHVPSMAPGETIVLGGWSAQPGQRMLIFVTLTAADSAGNKVDPPFDAQTRIVIDPKFVSAPDDAVVKAGLQTLFTDQNDTSAMVRCSDSDLRSKLEVLDQSEGTELLGSPRATTQAGLQACISVADMVMIAGKNQFIGPSLNVLPSLSADRASVDLTAIAQYNIPETGAPDGNSQQ